MFVSFDPRSWYSAGRQSVRILDTDFEEWVEAEVRDIGGCSGFYPIIQVYQRRGLNVPRNLAIYLRQNFGGYLIIDKERLEQLRVSAKQANYLPYEQYHHCILNSLAKQQFVGKFKFKENFLL